MPLSSHSSPSKGFLPHSPESSSRGQDCQLNLELAPTPVLRMCALPTIPTAWRRFQGHSLEEPRGVETIWMVVVPEPCWGVSINSQDSGKCRDLVLWCLGQACKFPCLSHPPATRLQWPPLLLQALPVLRVQRPVYEATGIHSGNTYWRKIPWISKGLSGWIWEHSQFQCPLPPADSVHFAWFQRGTVLLASVEVILHSTRCFHLLPWGIRSLPPQPRQAGEVGRC